MNDVVKIFMLVGGIALVTNLVAHGAQTGGIIGTIAAGFSNMLYSAMGSKNTVPYPTVTNP